MAKIVDITDKLNFEEKPKIVVKGEEFTVNDSATAMLKIIPELEKEATPQTINKLCETLFSAEDIKKIDALNLSFADFTTFVMAAIQLVTGEGEQGETVTPATT